MTLYTGTVRPVVRRDVWENFGYPAGTSFTRASTTYVGLPGSPIYLVVNIISSTVTVSSVSSTLGGSWSRVVQRTQGTMRQEVWVNSTTTGGTGTITVNLSASAVALVTSYVFQYADTTSWAIDVSQTGGTGTAIDTGSVTTTEDNQVAAIMTYINAASATNLTITNVSPPQLSMPIARRVATAVPTNTLALTVGEVFADWQNLTSQNYGAGTGIGWQGTLSASKDWISARFVMRGALIDMSDYNYKYTDTGLILNNATGTPIYDVDKVSGLTDINIDVESSDYDGATGGYTFAKYMSQKTIVLEGTVYASPFTESVADTFRANFVPQTDDQPLHFVHPGNTRRMIYCKPIGLKADIDQGRARGAMPYQVSLQAADPRMYETAEFQMLSAATGAGAANSITISGNTETAPVIWFWVTAAEIAASNQFAFTKVASVGPNRSIVVDANKLDTAQAYRLDFATRRLTAGSLNTDYTAALSTHDWWALTPGTQTINHARSSGYTDKAAIFWQEAYV